MKYWYVVVKEINFTNIPSLLILFIHNFMGIMEKYSGQDLLMGKLWGKCTISGMCRYTLII